MSVRAVCPKCQHVYQLSEQVRGKKVKCKECQTIFPVVAEPQFEVVDDEPVEKVKTAPTKRPKKRRRQSSGISQSKIIGFVGAGVAVVALFVGGLWLWKRGGSAKSLSQLVAQLDRNEKGWRLEEMEANRENIPADKNSATVIAAARKLFDKNWMSPETQESISRIPSNQKLDASTAAQLKQSLDSVEPALVEARNVAMRPRGRYPIVYARDGFSTKLDHAQPVREVVKLLQMDAINRSHNGDGAKAIHSCLAALNCGRSLFDEPISISQLVRLACQNLTAHSVERTLAQARCPDDSLITLQAALLDESQQPIYPIIAKCERAHVEAMWSAVRSGEVKLEEVKKLFAISGEKLDQIKTDADIERTYFWLLRHTNRMVEISRLPLHQLQKPLEEWEKTPADAPPGGSSFQIVGTKMATACQRGSARLSCAAVAIAAERYRRAKGDWPDKLSDLFSEFILEFPLDPFDGKSLRMARQPDGIIIYTVGPDLQDNSGVLDPENTNKPGTDIGFRMWIGNNKSDSK